MWRFCLLLALAAFTHNADADVIDTSVTEELISNEAKKEFEIESGLITLHSEDFAQALQAHPLLMVCLFSHYLSFTSFKGLQMSPNVQDEEAAKSLAAIM